MVKMRLCRGASRVRYVALLLGCVAATYVVSQLRTPGQLDAEEAAMPGYRLGRREAAGGAAAAGGSDTGPGQPGAPPLLMRNVHANYNYEGEEMVTYRRDTPLIWVGGIPRSGTTLMRAMLDAHPDVRCGEETRVVPRILSMHVGMAKSEKEMQRLEEAHITQDILDDALAAYILTIIARHGEMAPRLCNKDPFTLRSMAKINSLFPMSKFIFMVRDGRATCHSIITRHVTIKGFDVKTHKGCLKDWNRAITNMHDECRRVGRERCLPVYYEQLVLHPRPQMEAILRFLDVAWDDIVIHHETAINRTGGISLSNKELSTDQVEKPINTAALTSWVAAFPEDVRLDVRQLAPMLETLGYDPDAFPPDYGQPDAQVRVNNEVVRHELNPAGLIGRIVTGRPAVAPPPPAAGAGAGAAAQKVASFIGEVLPNLGLPRRGDGGFL